MKVLVFQHVSHEHVGLIAGFAKRHAIELAIIELWKPYHIPSVLNYDALIIMGGPMGVYDGKEIFPSKQDEVDAINKILGKIPVLGFCLGAQVLASALGAKVYPNIKAGKKIKEIGFYDIDLTSEGMQSPLFKGFKSPIHVLQWHGDTFDLPQDSLLLATSNFCHNQAFSYKNAFGLQFPF
jgi:GMP synthase (glutamine-hydrolysing)